MKFTDQFGNTVRVGRRYAVGRSRATGPICVVFEDPESGEQMIRRVKGDPFPQRLYGEDVDYALDPSTKFTLVDANGCEVTDPALADDDLAITVRDAVLRARALKDQLAGVEATLVEALDVCGDQQLRDAIFGAVHGDLGAEAVLELMGV